MTVVEWLHGLAASLTKSDLLPDCNHERCVDMTVCVRTLARPRGLDGRMLSWLWQIEECGSVLSLLLSLFSQKEEMARQKLKRKRLSQP